MYIVKMVLNAVISDCRTYWDNYYEKGIIAGAAFAFLYCIILLYRSVCYKNTTKGSIFSAYMKIPLAALLGFYCYLVLGITVLSRNKEAAYILRPVPFSTWGTDIASLTFWAENILMMIPMGILLYILWEPFRKTGWSVLYGFLFSLTIECIQLFTRRGRFETDDIVNNVFGMLIGGLLCKSIDFSFRKLLITTVISGVVLCTACAGKAEAESGTAKDGAVMEGSIEVKENLPDRDITVPEYLRGETEEKLYGENSDEENPDQEKGGDGCVYHLSGEEQAEMARQVAAQIEDSISQVLTDKDYYPNITGISVNSECTEFNVTFSGRELSLYENVLPVSLCIVGNRFQLYQGKQEEELLTVVNYIDADSGEIFSTIDSKEIE